MKILNVVGARPNFMKIAPVMAAYRAVPQIEPLLVHTGQHYDAAMSELFFAQLGIPKPDLNLGVGSASHAVQTAEIMTAFEPVIETHRPDIVVVVGDVNSTIACGLVAVKLGVRLAHVEAGLRSFDRTMPEEINRVCTDAISDFLFCTERSGVDNLAREGVPAAKVHLVGNVMIDTLLRNRAKADESDVLARLALEPRGYAALTLHRPANVDDPAVFGAILAALAEIQKELPVVFPVHPRTRARLSGADRSGLNSGKPSPAALRAAFPSGGASAVALAKAEGEPVNRQSGAGLGARVAGLPNLRLVEPMGYLDFLKLMAEARVVLTDSGGIQEETTILGVPCLTLRENTERPVTVELGTNRLVGRDPARILAGFRAALAADSPKPRIPPLWDGKAAERIVGVLAQ